MLFGVGQLKCGGAAIKLAARVRDSLAELSAFANYC
jgi:hypothetical protein